MKNNKLFNLSLILLVLIIGTSCNCGSSSPQVRQVTQPKPVPLVEVQLINCEGVVYRTYFSKSVSAYKEGTCEFIDLDTEKRIIICAPFVLIKNSKQISL